MTERTYHYRISPGVLVNDIFLQSFGAETITSPKSDNCCSITTTTTTRIIDGYTFVYSSMTEILSGGTNGSSILTELNIPIFLTENTVDIGYYSVFDGMVQQKDVVTNFIFTGSTSDPYRCIFFNTSDELKKFLSFSTYRVDWGDGTPIQTLNTGQTEYSHYYLSNGTYTIRLIGLNPWGTTQVEKTINIPFTTYSFTNPNGTAYFIPQGGSWSGTPISYDYIYSGDSICDVDLQLTSNYTPIPFVISGYTKSRIQDLRVYGVSNFSYNTIVTGTSGVVGIVYSPTNEFTAYTINNIDYYDFPNRPIGTRTIFVAESSGITEDMLICSALTKNEVLMNVIAETQIETNIFVERGKNSALESIQRLGEIDNIGDLEKYGYKFFDVQKV